MNRVLEDELTTDEKSVQAFKNADFSRLHEMICSNLTEIFHNKSFQCILDLGCGPGTLSANFLRMYKNTSLYEVDGSENMLKSAQENLKVFQRTNDIYFFLDKLPGSGIPFTKYDLIHASNFIHHLPDPNVLWQSILKYGTKDTCVFVMDLIRPESINEAEEIVNRVSAKETDEMREDHYKSLLAAFTLDEVYEQLKSNELHSNLKIKETKSHFIVHGVL